MEPAGCYAEARLTCRAAGATKGIPPEATESHLGLGYMHVSWLSLSGSLEQAESCTLAVAGLD